MALAYVRVSTEDQAEHGAFLNAQRAALAAEADRRGWDVEVVADEGQSGKSLKRPGPQSALTRLDRGETDVLLAVRLDRVSRSVADFAGLLDRCQRRGWGRWSSSHQTSTPLTRRAASRRTCLRPPRSMSGS
ncbi:MULTISPECIES: recombinase family protein [Micrococcus]|uniref:recombinase family protein n=1 Tax=Micrococcus TaxID=1269 RepID=UPI00130DD51A